MKKTYPDKRVQQFLGQVVPVKLNTDLKTTAPYAAKYKVQVIPNVFVLSPTGKVLYSFVGYKPPVDFIAALKPYVKSKAAMTPKR